MPDHTIHHLRWEVLAGKWAVKKKFVGLWRVTELQGFDSAYVDLCGPAKMKVSTRGACRMNFGAVELELDCKMDVRDESVLRFSFVGTDEDDMICGRGYCLVEGNEMIGRVFRHFGDEFGFKAKRSGNEAKH